MHLELLVNSGLRSGSMVLVSEVINGIHGVFDTWQIYCKVTDAPADIDGASFRINLRLTRLQGWITYIQQASLNEEQLQTITSMLPGLKGHIEATIDEIEKFRKEGSGSLQKKAEWFLSHSGIVENRLRALDVVLNEGDQFFRQHCNGFGGMPDTSPMDDSETNLEAPDPGDVPVSDDRNMETPYRSSSSLLPGDSTLPGAPESVDECEIGTAASLDPAATPVSFDLSTQFSEGGHRDVGERVPPSQFFDGFSKVFSQVHPWKRGCLKENLYSPGSHEDSFYKLISSLRTQSTVKSVQDQRSCNITGFSFQQWFKAGAWYLALARTLLFYRGRFPGYETSPIVYGTLVKAKWASLTISDLPLVPDDEEERTIEQRERLRSECNDTIGQMNHLLHAVCVTYTIDEICSGLDEFWSLGNVGKEIVCYSEEDIALLASRILLKGPIGKVMEPSKVPGQDAELCPSSYIVIPQPYESCPEYPNLLYCYCGDFHCLRYQVNTSTICELRYGNLTICQLASKVIGEQLPGESPVRLTLEVDAPHDLLRQLQSLIRRLKASETSLMCCEVSVDSVDCFMGLTRSPFDPRPANTLLLRDTAARLIKPSSQVKERSLAQRLFGGPPQTRVAADKILRSDIQKGSEPTIGRFFLKLARSDSDSTMLIRLVNTPLNFFLDIWMSDDSKPRFLRHGDHEIHASFPLEDESRKIRLVVRLQMRFACKEELNMFHQQFILAQVSANFVTSEYYEWNVEETSLAPPRGTERHRGVTKILLTQRTNIMILWNTTNMAEFAVLTCPGSPDTITPGDETFNTLVLHPRRITRWHICGDKRFEDLEPERVVIRLQDQRSEHTKQLRTVLCDKWVSFQCEILLVELRYRKGMLRTLADFQNAILEVLGLVSSDQPTVRIWLPRKSRCAHTQYGLYELTSHASVKRDKDDASAANLEGVLLTYITGPRCIARADTKRRDEVKGSLRLTFEDRKSREIATGYLSQVIGKSR